MKQADKDKELEMIDGLIKTMDSAETMLVTSLKSACQVWLYTGEVAIIKRALESYREAIDNG